MASWDEDSPEKPFPAGKLGTGPLGSARLDYRAFRAKKGMFHWNEMSLVLHLCQCQQVSTWSCTGQPGAAQGVRKADRGPQHTAKTGRQRDWLAKQGKLSLNIWAVWSPQCSPHSLVLSHFVWCFPPAFLLCNIPFPCYVGTERKETAGRKEVKIFVQFNIDKGFYSRLICRLRGCFPGFIIICYCADFKNISVPSILHLYNPISCKNSFSSQFLGNQCLEKWSFLSKHIHAYTHK